MNDETPALAQRRAVPLWRNVPFTLMWTSIAASGFGDRMVQLAAMQILGIDAPEAQAASIQAAVTFFFFLPYIFIDPFGGWLADTLPRKWLMLFCDETRAVVLLAAALLLWYYAPSYRGTLIPKDHSLYSLAIYSAYGSVLLTGAAAAIFSPTRDAMTPQIIPPRQLQAANASILAIATIAALIGLGIGGWIIKEHSVLAALMAGVLCFGISGTFWAFINPHHHAHVPTEHRHSQWRRMVEGVRYVSRHRRVLELYGLSVLFWGVAGIVLAAIAALCKLRYTLPSDNLLLWISVMQMTMGFGMLASSVLLALFGQIRESHWLLLLGLVAGGAALVGMWAIPLYSFGLVFAFVMGFSANITRVCTDTLTQAISPNYVRGRVFGLREILTNISAVLVNLVIWQIPRADPLMINVMLVLAIVLLLVGAVGAWRELRRGPFPWRRINVVWRMGRLYALAWHKARWIGRHYVPAQGPVLLAAHHTAGLDPILIQTAVPRPIRWVMLRSYQHWLLGFVWRCVRPIGIDAENNTRQSFRAMLDALAAGDIVCIFPAGGIDREHHALRPFAPGIGMLAARSSAVVVPVWIQGTPRGQNMIWHFLKPSRSVVVFGAPYRPDSSWDYHRIADDLRQRIEHLATTAR